MVFVKKFNQEYFVCRAKGSRAAPFTTPLSFYDWFPVRAGGKGKGIASLGESVSCPNEFIGKKIRLKIEVLD